MNVSPRRRWAAAAIAVLALCLPGAAAAQSGSDPLAAAGGAPLPAEASLVRDAAGAAVIRARRVTEPLTIDGRLDEAVYARTPPITDFIQQEPASGAPISEQVRPTTVHGRTYLELLGLTLLKTRDEDRTWEGDALVTSTTTYRSALTDRLTEYADLVTKLLRRR